MSLKTTLPIIGIDPGKTNGCITIYHNKKYSYHRMPEELKDIMELLKPCAGDPSDTRCRCSIEMINLRPSFNPFQNARMKTLDQNFDRLKSALTLLNISYQTIHPATWQNWHGLVLPKGVREKGLDAEYDELMELKRNLTQIPKHLKIEKEMRNRVKLVNGQRHICTSTDITEERSKLNDDYTYFGVESLKQATKEIEKRIDSIKSKITQVRKKRYQKKAQKLTNDPKLALWKADATLLCIYEAFN